jgi:hypothetical protein
MLTFGFVFENTQQVPDFALFRKTYQDEPKDHPVERQALARLIYSVVIHIQNKRAHARLEATSLVTSSFEPNLRELSTHLRKQLPPARPLSEFTYDIWQLVELMGREFINDVLELKSQGFELIKMLEHCWSLTQARTLVAAMKQLLAAKISEQGLLDLIYRSPQAAEYFVTLRIELAASGIIANPCETREHIELRQKLFDFLASPSGYTSRLCSILAHLPRRGINIDTHNFHKLCEYHGSMFYSVLIEYADYLETVVNLLPAQINHLMQVILTELADDLPEHYDGRMHTLSFLTKSTINTLDTSLADKEVALLTPVERIMSFIGYIARHKNHLELLDTMLGNQIFFMQQGYSHHGGRELINAKFFILIGELLAKQPKDCEPESEVNCALNFVNALYGEENSATKGFLRVRLGIAMKMDRSGMHIDIDTTEQYATAENIRFLAQKALEFSPATLMGDILKRLFIFTKERSTYIALQTQQEHIRRTLDQVTTRQMAENLLSILVYTQEILTVPEYEQVNDVFRKRLRYLSEIIACLNKSNEFYPALCQLAEQKQLTKTTFDELINQYKPSLLKSLGLLFLKNDANAHQKPEPRAQGGVSAGL